VLKRLALQDLVAERDLDAHALARSQRHHLVGGEAPLGQDIEHLAAHIAGGAHDRDLETHRHSPIIGTCRTAARRANRRPRASF
jgi:hypothetical protein